VQKYDTVCVIDLWTLRFRPRLHLKLQAPTKCSPYLHCKVLFTGLSPLMPKHDASLDSLAVRLQSLCTGHGRTTYVRRDGSYAHYILPCLKQWTSL
jgi:hypothetical protein